MQYSWTEAFISCMDRNMTLVTINTEQKSNEINQLVKKIFNTNKNLWVGGIMSRYPQNRYIWLSTGKPFNYTNWDSSNPNFYESKQYCIQIGLNNQMQWNDYPCYEKLGFICESDEKHLKYENLQLEMNKLIKEKEMREKMLQQELENIKRDIKQKDENVLKLKQDLEKSQNKLKHLEETKKISENEQDTEKCEKFLQQEFTWFKTMLKQKFEKDFESGDNLQRDSQNKLKNIENNIDILENKENLVQQMDHFKNIKNPYFNIVHFHQDRYVANEIRQN